MRGGGGERCKDEKNKRITYRGKCNPYYTMLSLKLIKNCVLSGEFLRVNDHFKIVFNVPLKH